MDTPTDPAPDEAGRRLLGGSFLIVVCVGGPGLALRAAPKLAAIAAVSALVTGVLSGPRPVPGLRPGLTALTVVVSSIFSFIAGVSR